MQIGKILFANPTTQSLLYNHLLVIHRNIVTKTRKSLYRLCEKYFSYISLKYLLHNCETLVQWCLHLADVLPLCGKYFCHAM